MHVLVQRLGKVPLACHYHAVAGVCGLSLSFTHRTQISHCQARLEAAGVHFRQNDVALAQENKERQRVYKSIEREFHAGGLALDGLVTQGLKMHDLFQVCPRLVGKKSY